MTAKDELIGPEDARAAIEAGEALLVCAYEDEEEAREQLLEGAILLGELEARRDAGLAKDEALIFYCDCPHEEAALSAAGEWREAGFTDVRCLEGGVKAWRAAGYPLANDLALTGRDRSRDGGEDDDERAASGDEGMSLVREGDSYGESDDAKAPAGEGGSDLSARAEEEVVGTTQASGLRERFGDTNETHETSERSEAVTSEEQSEAEESEAEESEAEESEAEESEVEESEGQGQAIGEALEATGMRKDRLSGSRHGSSDDEEDDPKRSTGEPPRTRARSSRARSRSKDKEAVPGGHHPTGRGSQSDGQYEAFGQVSQGASEGEGSRSKDEDEVPSGHERSDRGMRSDGRFESQGTVDEEVGARSDQEPEEADATKLNEAGKQATSAAGAMEAGARATRRLRAGRGKKGVPRDAGADVSGSSGSSDASSGASEEKPSRGRRSEGKKARDVMTRDPSFVAASASVQEAACLMRDQDIGSLPVRDADGRFCGMITDRDIAIRCVAEGKELGACKVEECMTREFVACDEDAAVTEVGRTMQEHQIRRIPVLKKGEADKAHPAEIVGIISLGDLATDLQANIPAATLKKVSQPAHAGA